MNVTRFMAAVVFLLSVMLSLPGWGGERKREPAATAPPAQIETATVELFTAINQGKITVTVVPQSYFAFTLRVRNNTLIPLKIALPTTIAAVPTARLQAARAMQFGRSPMSLANGYGQGGYGQGGYGQGEGSAQGLGGSLAGPWSGGTLAQNALDQGNEAQGDSKPATAGPWYWTLGPRQMFQTRIPSFCLEFGKPDPHSHIPYQLCPLTDLNRRPMVEALLEQFAKQGVNQCVAQLAAWHLANDVPWQMLTKVQFPRTPGMRAHRVTPLELVAAQQFVESLPSYGQPASLGRERTE